MLQTARGLEIQLTNENSSSYFSPKRLNRTPLRYWLRFFRCHHLLYVLQVPETEHEWIKKQKIGNSNMIYFPPRMFTFSFRYEKALYHSQQRANDMKFEAKQSLVSIHTNIWKEQALSQCGKKTAAAAAAGTHERDGNTEKLQKLELHIVNRLYTCCILNTFSICATKVSVFWVAAKRTSSQRA